MKLLPFDFADTCRYFINFSDEDKALIYGIVDGTPQYLSQMNDNLSIEENIKNTFLNPTSSLFEEICKQYLWKRLLDGKSLVEFAKLGRWWGTDSTTGLPRSSI